ncbi:ABC transporter substrate-binding protein [Pseudorhodoplanes sp.]|uniref:ABC transporter substrate-binding protein n=1 Tax=Pseudorhodoplanes sp. TaxID=1934341 RepID=UPI003D0D0C9C
MPQPEDNQDMADQRHDLLSRSLDRREAIYQFAVAGLALGAGMKPDSLLAQAAEERLLRVTESTLADADPHRPTDVPGSILMFNLYDFLVTAPRGAGPVTPSLATAWAVSDDARTYTFTLRNDVVFHDGTLLTADDVVFSLGRIKAIKRGFSSLFANVNAAEALDAATVKFTLAVPSAPFLASLVRLAIVNKKLAVANKAAGDFGELGDYGQAYMTRNDAGSGPYILTRHEAQQETAMTLNERHFRRPSNKTPTRVSLRFGLEAATVRNLLARHELELTRVSLPPEVLLSASRAPGVKLAQDRGSTQFHFKLNTTRAPMDDIEFRRAVVLGYDYEAHHSLLNLAGVASGFPARGPIPQGVLGYDPDKPVPKRDLAAAKAALAKSKYKSDEYPISLMFVREFAQVEKYALLFQKSMADLGINVEIAPTPWAQYQQLVTKPETTPHVNCIYVALTTPDVDSLFYPSYHSSAGGTYFSMQWLKDNDIDAALDKGRTILDAKARETHYRALAETISNLYCAIYAYEQVNVIAHQDYVWAPFIENMQNAVPIFGGNFQFAAMEIRK